MTTSYIREAQKKLKAEKKIAREQEAMARIERKMAIINGEVVEEVKPKKTTKKVTKKTTKKPAAKKRGRPKKS